MTLRRVLYKIYFVTISQTFLCVCTLRIKASYLGTPNGGYLVILEKLWVRSVGVILRKRALTIIWCDKILIMNY